MVKRRHNTTKHEILQTALHLFLEIGYSNTHASRVARELDISIGNITYYYPTKEHLLAELIEMLADYQWQVFQEAVDDGETPVTALCFELVAMAAMCEESQIAKDLYISAYTSELALSIIRRTDCQRAKQVFAQYRPDWTEENFAVAEMLVSGMEYSALRVTQESPPLDSRLAATMEAILALYGVPEQRRRMKIDKALSMDYRKYARHVLADFKKYVEKTTVAPFTPREEPPLDLGLAEA